MNRIARVLLIISAAVCALSLLVPAVTVLIGRSSYAIDRACIAYVCPLAALSIGALYQLRRLPLFVRIGNVALLAVAASVWIWQYLTLLSRGKTLLWLGFLDVRSIICTICLAMGFLSYLFARDAHADLKARESVT